MANYGFLLTIILALIVLLIALVFITLAYFENGAVVKDAVASGNSKFMADADSVSTYLLIATFAGWTFFILTITYIIIAFITGTFNVPAMKNFFKKKSLTEHELLEFVNDVHETSEIKRNIIIGFIELAVTMLIAIIVSIMAVVASISVGSVTVSSHTPAVQSKALIGGLAGFASAALTITAIFFLKKEYSEVTKLAKDSNTYMSSNITTAKVKSAEQKLASDKDLAHKIKQEADSLHNEPESKTHTANKSVMHTVSDTTSNIIHDVSNDVKTPLQELEAH